MKAKIMGFILGLVFQIYGQAYYVKLWGKFYPYSFYLGRYANVPLETKESAITAYNKSRRAYNRGLYLADKLLIGGKTYVIKRKSA